jgi:hypothetical protein
VSYQPSYQPYARPYPGRYPGPPGGYAPPQPKRQAGATAIVAAVFGLIVGGIAFSLPFATLISLPRGTGIGYLKGAALVDLGIYLLAGVIALIGAVTVFVRPAGGLVTLLIGALVASAAPWIEPLLAHIQTGRLFGQAFGFKIVGAYARVSGIVLAPALLLLVVVALVIRSVRGRRQLRPVAPGAPRPAGKALPLGMLLGGNPVVIRVAAVVILLAVGLPGALCIQAAKHPQADVGVIGIVAVSLGWAAVIIGGFLVLARKKVAGWVIVGGAALAVVVLAVAAVQGRGYAFTGIGLALVAATVGSLGLVTPGAALLGLRSGRPVPPQQAYPPHRR